MKLTVTEQEATLQDILAPDSEKTFGNRGIPRYMEPSMSDILSWSSCPSTEHPKDYKTKTKLLKDRINKSGDPWKTENVDNYRKHVYNIKKGKALFGSVNIDYRVYSERS